MNKINVAGCHVKVFSANEKNGDILAEKIAFPTYFIL